MAAWGFLHCLIYTDCMIILLVRAVIRWLCPASVGVTVRTITLSSYGKEAWSTHVTHSGLTCPLLNWKLLFCFVFLNLAPLLCARPTWWMWCPGTYLKEECGSARLAHAAYVHLRASNLLIDPDVWPVEVDCSLWTDRSSPIMLCG